MKVIQTALDGTSDGTDKVIQTALDGISDGSDFEEIQKKGFTKG